MLSKSFPSQALKLETNVQVPLYTFTEFNTMPTMIMIMIMIITIIIVIIIIIIINDKYIMIEERTITVCGAGIGIGIDFAYCFLMFFSLRHLQESMDTHLPGFGCYVGWSSAFSW